jgi:hypothetical protein
MNVVTRQTTVLGFLTWLVPFVVSFLFVESSGHWIIPQPLFKSIMVVVFGGFGTALLLAAFRRIRPTMRSGLALGGYWLAINLALDLAVLRPLAGMSVQDYLYDIGLRYLLIPIIAAAMGATADRARKDAATGAGSPG